MAESRPNVVYIHTHDTGRFVAPYGYNAHTPNLSAFAGESAVFRNAHSAAPTCSPSRAALLTGEYPHTSGMLGLAHFGHSLTDPRKHLLYTLREAGYASVLAGMQHVAHDPRSIGYDQLLLDPATVPTVDTVCPAFEEFMNQSPSEPFFASVGLTETHRAFEEPGDRECAPAFCQIPSPIPDTPETREDAAAFAASLRRADEGIGRVLEALRRAGLYERSIIIVTTDHGPPFPEMKCNLTVHGTGVMLFLRAPGVATGRRDGATHVEDALVSQMDLYPTVCDLVGLEKPPWLEGESLVPLLRGETSHVRDELFAEVNEHVAYEPMRAARTGRYLYIRRFAAEPSINERNCDDGPTKSLFVRNGWLDRPVPTEELYDTLFDPQERRNLAGVEGYAGVLQEMRGRLRRWMERTEDPLLG